jgi:hypothetical protein
MLATLDYPQTDTHPAFNVLLQVNFKSGLQKESFGVKFIGSEGVMTTSFDGVSVTRTPRPDEFDNSTTSFAERTQKQLRQEWDAKHGLPSVQRLQPSAAQTFNTENNDPQLEHHRNFVRSIREGTPSVEDATFGLRAAGPALLTNESYFRKCTIGWDPEAMKVV